MRVTYLKSITTPKHIAGQQGQTRELPEELANNLLSSGHVRLFRAPSVIATPQAQATEEAPPSSETVE